MIETRKNEKRYVTSEPKEMLNMYLTKRVLKTWTEDFIDESTGKSVSVERNEVLFERGTLIDQDMLAKIRFGMEADGVKEVEVSNQKRLAYEWNNVSLVPYVAQAVIGDKKCKFLLYACSLENMIEVLKDYIELNYQSFFTILMGKRFDDCVILTDNLKTYEEKAKEDEADDNDKEKDERKFYKIGVMIGYGEESEQTGTFIVKTFTIDRAMMIIHNWLMKREEEQKENCEKNNMEWEEREIKITLESANQIPIGQFIPLEFSMAYKE